MNAADDPATARIRNLGAQLDAASANRKPRVWHDIVAPWVTAVLVVASLVMIGYVIAIANGSADSQDVSSCRAEFNARMQAASVVLISETVSAALARHHRRPGDDRPAQRPVGRRNGAHRRVRRRSEAGSRGSCRVHRRLPEPTSVTRPDPESYVHEWRHRFGRIGAFRRWVRCRRCGSYRPVPAPPSA